MPKIDQKCVIVQELMYSKHARRRYRLSPQRRCIGTIDIRDIESNKELYDTWMQLVGQKGNFSLLARTGNGRLRKCIAIITVTDNGIRYKDNRCALASMIRSRSETAPKDMRI